VIKPSEATLRDLVRAADARGEEIHFRLTPTAPSTYRCRYCRRPMRVSAHVFDENPFCAFCLHERLTRTPDPLDGPRLECGLPLPGATRYEG
jgi:hypothetical protein